MLGIDIFSSSLIFSAILCFFAGLLSFLSPCVLPILPPYLAYMAGTTVSEIKNNSETIKRGILLSAISFSLGLSVVFIILGLAANSMASIFILYQNELRIVSGLLIIIFGLHFIGLLRITFLQKDFRLDLNIKERGNFLPPFLLGLTFAFGWTPCIGPILGSILAIIAQDVSVLRGILLMIFYSLGLSLPFIGMAYLLIRGVFITKLISTYSLYIERFTGGFLIIIGLLFLSGSFQLIGFFILEYLPFLSLFG
tara:strand:+ start:1375 stop:2133 length:759 start_codon:yes stop_codon:yes gene_type:complete